MPAWSAEPRHGARFATARHCPRLTYNPSFFAFLIDAPRADSNRP